MSVESLAAAGSMLHVEEEKPWLLNDVACMESACLVKEVWKKEVRHHKLEVKCLGSVRVANTQNYYSYMVSGWEELEEEDGHVNCDEMHA